MLRPLKTALALAALTGGVLVVPTAARADTTATVEVVGGVVRFDASGRLGTARIAYRCFDPQAVTPRRELQTSLEQPDHVDGHAVGLPDTDLFVTCDDTARTTVVTYARTHLPDDERPAKNGKGELSFYLGSGGPGDFGPVHKKVTVTGVVGTGDRARPFDFDGDGRDDLAVGTPGESVGTEDFAGSVTVLRGVKAGTTAVDSQLWSQASSGIAGTAEFGDRFGAVVASSDFDGDGHADLAVGVPADTVSGKDEAGSVNVLYGTSSGLASAHDQQWSQASKGVPGSAEGGDRFGSALATGDFNGDGYGDLAVGVPEEAEKDLGSAGRIHVLYGSTSGLRSKGSQSWAQSSSGVRGSSERNDRFGASLAAADVDGDGRSDLAVGVPGENAGTGAVALLRGSKKGITASSDELWSQNSTGLDGTAATGDLFGAALSFGDFDADGHPDLAVGVPSKLVQPCDECDSQGAVQILRGSGQGLTTAGNRVWHVGQPGLPGDAAGANDFGQSLVSGDFDGDGAADLAVAAPGADVDDQPGAGAVYVLDGSDSGLQAHGSVLTQATAGVPGDPEPVGGFAMSLAARRFSSERDSLVVGLPGITVGGHKSAGGVLVVPGSEQGLVPSGTQLWTQASPRVDENPEDLDQFGHVAG
ncbi:FG-GAP-like repeat-containing protein [Microlunatus flavus]|uniref:Repeat domain-containing protein n=1 Tax=Microlunatus flavus TaxID=1036181 RepID=A0A1H9IXH2_9ACTN|nr:FG-GAP-like repeat-containing protein [Microlunatus flavus]SEQ79501.1 Repeat domain-containing protein [Microlunatus flavus]